MPTDMTDIERNGQELFLRLSKDMRQGLRQIYKEISSASSAPPTTAAQTDALFHEASAQLSEVLSTTQAATESIMDIVESQLDNQAEAQGILDAAQRGTATAEQLQRAAEINAGLGDDLTTIMTSLSFQDLTGQRIQKVVAALKTIETTVVALYVASGLIINGREEDPHKDARLLEEEARAAAEHIKETRGSQLKGPVNGVSQAQIDDLLAQLDMD